jgi:hypothetical protein
MTFATAVRGCTLQTPLVRAITKVAGDGVQGVKYTCFIQAHFVRAAEWH